jgi:RND family efflux transporter MFP subunit
MRYTEPDEPGSKQTAGSAADRLLEENLALKRQLQELQGTKSGAAHGRPAGVWKPSRITMACLILGAAVLLVIAFFAGYLPLRRQQQLIVNEAQQQEQALPRVDVIQVGRSTKDSELELPGSVQAIAEAPILARATGYIRQRAADLGDRVKPGQLLAEIDAPELDEQVRQAKAAVQQTHSTLDRAIANHEQGKADLEFARITSERWRKLFDRGVVSRQENDQYLSQYQSKAALVQALEKAIAVERSNIAAAEANLARLVEMQSFKQVKAPFDSVITQRNVDVGALVNAGGTLLFRIAQTGMLRVYVNVPQANAGMVKPGQPAALHVSNLPGRTFPGVVARTANALDPGSRTMLVEVHVPNPDGALMPGMYAEVELSSARVNPPLLIPSDSLIVRADGTRVALVKSDHTVHLQKVEVGRDYGDRLEVISGLQEGDTLIPNPGDTAREGLAVEPIAAAK